MLTQSKSKTLGVTISARVINVSKRGLKYGLKHEFGLLLADEALRVPYIQQP